MELGRRPFLTLAQSRAQAVASPGRDDRLGRARIWFLVWVLHLAYFWVPAHLALRTLAEPGVVSSSPATHAVGAIGGLVIGMMTGTARGHTARPLRADRFDTTCYVLVSLAGVVRVALPLPAHTLAAVQWSQWSAILWSVGFGLYVVRYCPALRRARPDGKPG